MLHLLRVQEIRTTDVVESQGSGARFNYVKVRARGVGRKPARQRPRVDNGSGEGHVSQRVVGIHRELVYRWRSCVQGTLFRMRRFTQKNSAASRLGIVNNQQTACSDAVG